VEERDVELVEFDAGVEAVREFSDYASAEKGLDAADLVGEPESPGSEEKTDEGEGAEEDSVAMEESNQKMETPKDS
jgi:hypothetical protein